MGRQLIAIVVGLAGGGLAIMLIEALSSLCYPPPEGLTRDDKQALIQFIQGLPVGAFLFVLAAHAGGSGLGGFLSASSTCCPSRIPSGSRWSICSCTCHWPYWVAAWLPSAQRNGRFPKPTEPATAL